MISYASARTKGRAKVDEALTQSDYETLAAFRLGASTLHKLQHRGAPRPGTDHAPAPGAACDKGLAAGCLATVGYLADQLLVAPNTAAEFVVRLESAGLLAKTADPKDRRRIVLKLSPRAETCLRRLTLAHRREVRSLAHYLSALLRELDAAAPSEG